MGAVLHVEPISLADDDLYTLFNLADQAGDLQAGQAMADEIIRRSHGRPPTVHEVPAWLAKLLPRAMWHQKPGGGGE